MLFLLVSCREAETLETFAEISLEEIIAIAEKKLISIAEDEIEEMFYLRSLYNEKNRLYWVEYASYSIESSLWIGAVVIDGQTGEVEDVETNVQFYSGVMPLQGAGFRVKEEELINNFGSFTLIDYNQDFQVFINNSEE